MRRLAPLIVTAMALPGCYKFTEEFVVMPDGSGKLALMVAGKEDEKDPKKDEDVKGEFTPEKLEKGMPGSVAATPPEVKREGGWVYVRFTVYFDDLSRLKWKEDSGADIQTFSFKKQGDGFVFELVGKKDEEKEKPKSTDPEAEKRQKEKWLKEMEGFEMGVKVTMPGDVRSIEGFQTKDGRVANFKITVKDLEKDEKAIEKSNAFKSVCGASNLSEAEQSAFKKELAEAKEKWAKMKTDAKKDK